MLVWGAVDVLAEDSVLGQEHVLLLDVAFLFVVALEGFEIFCEN